MKVNKIIVKSYLFAVLFTCISFNGIAQQLYGGFDYGQGWGINKKTLEITSIVDDNGTVTENKSSIHYSYGSGKQWGFHLGYRFKNKISFELGFSQVKSKKISYAYWDYWYDAMQYNTTDIKNSLEGIMKRIIPGIRLDVGEKKRGAYIRLGFIAGVGRIDEVTRVETEHRYGGPVDGETRIETRRYNGRISMGVHTAIGLNFMFTPNIGVYAETGMYGQQWAPKKSRVIDLTINNIPRLNALSLSAVETLYVNNYEAGENPNKDDPTLAPKKYFPFSSFALNGGICFRIGLKKEKDSPVE